VIDYVISSTIIPQGRGRRLQEVVYTVLVSGVTSTDYIVPDLDPGY
jgi:hypothetical protein